jgi:hypothetical protein
MPVLQLYDDCNGVVARSIGGSRMLVRPNIGHPHGGSPDD